ncbi:MAG: hypothetical protein H6737_21265 [Alphaproteobacteria bacterium]|nr:hypothetical protein [Alphaproteobacteria bacterium]
MARWWCVLPFLAACPRPTPTPQVPVPSAVDRGEWNRRAALHHVPAFWVSDDADPGVPGPDEVVWLWTGGAPQPLFVDGAPIEALARVSAGAPDAGDARIQAVLAELAHGRPSVVLTEVTAAERPFVEAMLAVGDAIDALHGLQRGSAGIEPAPDGPSRALSWRNQGPWCEQSTLEEAPECRATVEPVPRRPGVYPSDMEVDSAVCAELEAHDPPLMDPFTAVRREGDDLVAVPYPQAFPEASERAATALEAAASTLSDEEAAMAAYLRAAAQAFRDNDQVAADRAWLGTRGKSAWYVRVGPDETYWEPCDRKAGYHLVFARINPASIEWQEKLEPLKQELEAAIAERSGPYVARDVAFSLPEFIDITLNAGDSRAPLGGTTGQSLPNWGPVAEAGGRTVAMTNLDSDPDSIATRRARAASMLCTLDGFTDDPTPLLVSTVLHEAAHNLGPASGYTVDGKTDEQAFGGELATMLEELKAQTAAMLLTDFLAEKAVVTEDFARQAHIADFVWMLGQISNGMVDAEGGAEPYPQLSAIQLGLLMESGAVEWKADATAANGQDAGCFAIDAEALPGAIEALADEVFGVKGRADAERGRALRESHAPGSHVALFQTVTERWRRGPTGSFVYGFRFTE